MLLVLRGTEPSMASAAPTNLLLVTLDTTRADRLGVYGYDRAHTPAIDGLAATGTLFEQAFTSSPMTLPAHATLMTGRQPPEHGLRLNGAGILPRGIPTLAELLAARGYQTGAFIAAFVLDSKFGLDRGFATYDDDLRGAPPQEVPEPLSVYRPGNLVMDRALAWLRSAVSRKQPFFCWVHMYDAHYPYLPHPELARDGLPSEASYDTGIAFMDKQLERLLEFVRAARLTERTLVVVVGDHGEGLGDHGEVEHGYLLNREVLQVPLIMSLPGRIRSGGRVNAIVSLVDVTPTMFDLLGATSDTFGGSGRSLIAALDGKPLASQSSYAETDMPMQFAWSGLRSITTSRWKYIRTPIPELYDRAADPFELRNLASALRDPTAALDAELADIERAMKPVGTAATPPLDAEARRRLEALGYVTAPPTTTAGPSRDIKDMLPVKHLETRLARGVATGTLAPTDVLAIAQDLVAKSPETPAFQMSLGSALVSVGRAEEATTPLREAIRLRPDFAEAHTNLGAALAQLGRADEALNEQREALRLKPDLPEAHLNMGNLLSARGTLGAAIEHYRTAIRMNPSYAEAHCNLGSTLAQQGKAREARAQYEIAVRLKPRFAVARHNLARALAAEGNLEAAATHAREAIRIAPDFAAAHYGLGRVLAELGQTEEAIRQYEEATRLQPGEADFFDHLAAAYVAAGRIGDGVTAAGRSVALARASGQERLAADAARRLAVYEGMMKPRRTADPGSGR